MIRKIVIVVQLVASVASIYVWSWVQRDDANSIEFSYGQTGRHG